MTTETVILEQLHSFKGTFPDIPLPEDIDLKELGEQSFFFTLPIGEIGAKSTNGMLYGESVVRQLVEQVNSNRPEGMWGHLRDDERGTKYAPPAVRWLAAMVDDKGIAWGKGIPVTDDAREHLRIAKITNSAVGTSIYGVGKVENGQVKELKLETIDLAPAPRVGVAITAKVPSITKEIEDKDKNKMAEITEQLVSELNSKVTELTNTIKEQSDLLAAIKAVTSDDPVKTVGEMRSEIKTLREAGLKSIYENTVAEFVKVPISTEGGKALTEYVTSVLGEFSKYKDAEEIKSALERLSESATYKVVAKALISEAQGGAVKVENKSEDKTDPNGTKEITSESAKLIAAKYGVVVN